jgi:hypothetical protein
MHAVDHRFRPVGFGIRAFLLVATPLAFLGGTQVTLLSEHTETYWAWMIALPISAIFIGASFLATAVLFAWGLQAIVMLVWGILLCSRPHHAGAVWPWPLAPLAAEAIAAWLLGIGGSAAYITLRGDRADMPGAALSYIVLGAIWIAGAIFAGDAFHNGPDAVLYILFAASVIIVGVAGAMVSYREGRYLPLGGELRADAPHD